MDSHMLCTLHLRVWCGELQRGWILRWGIRERRVGGGVPPLRHMHFRVHGVITDIQLAQPVSAHGITWMRGCPTSDVSSAALFIPTVYRLDNCRL